MNNYPQLIERISKASSLSAEEIERKIEAKRAKLSGLISKEGAAQIVAAELGINLDQERLKIAELFQGMKRANVTGKILKIGPIREFEKNNRKGKVANLLLADETSNIRTVFWDTNHIELLEKGKIKENDTVEISNANIRNNNELHVSSFSDIKKSDEKIENVMTEVVFAEKKLSEAKPGDNLKVRATVVNAFEPRYFEVCPQCARRVLENKCKTHGTVSPVKRALLNIILDDGTETMRCVIFGPEIKNLGLKDNEIFSSEEYGKVKGTLLGKEKYFSGQLRINQLYNTTEFTIQEIRDINPDELITKLEASI